MLTEHGTEVIRSSKATLLSTIRDDTVHTKVGHSDEARRTAHGPEDTLIIAFEDESDGCEEVEQEQQGLAGEPAPELRSHGVRRRKKLFLNQRWRAECSEVDVTRIVWRFTSDLIESVFLLQVTKLAPLRLFREGLWGRRGEITLCLDQPLGCEV